MPTKPIYNGNGERIPLREYLEGRIDTLEQHINLKLDAAQVANQIQNQANREHFQLANQWKEFASGLLNNTVSKDMWDKEHKSLEDRVIALEISREVLNSKASTISVTVNYIITIILAFVTILTFILERFAHFPAK